MLSLIPTHKFLLDENVKIKLFQSLTDKGYDVVLVPKGAKDSKINLISKRERRVLVTNDEDFVYYTSSEIFSVIWLRIPQADTQALLTVFDKILKEIKTFSKKLTVLYEDKWDQFPLGKELKNEGKFKVVVWRRP